MNGPATIDPAPVYAALSATGANPYAAMHLARRLLLTAWPEWLCSNPPANLVAEELATTSSALRLQGACFDYEATK